MDFEDAVSASDDGEVIGGVFGDENGITDEAFADHVFMLRTIAPRGFVEIVGGEENSALRSEIEFADDAKGFDGSSDTGFHVAGTAALEKIAFHTGRREREVDGVEVAIELQGFSAGFPLETNSDGGGFGIAPVGTGDIEAFGDEHVGEEIGDGFGIAGGTGAVDHGAGRLEETVAGDGVLDASGEFGVRGGIHGRLVRSIKECIHGVHHEWLSLDAHCLARG